MKPVNPWQGSYKTTRRYEGDDGRERTAEVTPVIAYPGSPREELISFKVVIRQGAEKRGDAEPPWHEAFVQSTEREVAHRQADAWATGADPPQPPDPPTM